MDKQQHMLALHSYNESIVFRLDSGAGAQRRRQTRQRARSSTATLKTRIWFLIACSYMIPSARALDYTTPNPVALRENTHATTKLMEGTSFVAAVRNVQHVNNSSLQPPCRAVKLLRLVSGASTLLICSWVMMMFGAQHGPTSNCPTWDPDGNMTFRN